MNRLFTAFALIIASFPGYSQELMMDATYFDKSDNPYKIEQKYSDDQTVLYVRHDNRISVCVGRKTTQNSDTTIVQETYYNIFREKTKLEKFLECDSWIVTSNQNGDTVKYTGYFWDDLIGDTILTGEAAKQSWNFTQRIEKARVPLIIANNINVSLDSLVPNESFRAYFLNGLPVKIERFNREQEKLSLVIGVQSHNSMIYKSFFIKDTLVHYATDSIYWNNDTTKIKLSTTRFDWDESFTTNYQLNGTTVIMNYKSGKKDIKFLDEPDIFTNLFIGRMLYNDVLYNFELRLFDRQKSVSEVTSDGQVIINEYTLDSQDRIITQMTYQDQEFQRRILYDYKKEK